MLRPEVAEVFELTSHVTKLHVTRTGQDVDLTQVSLAEAEELMALPGGFEWLRRKQVTSKKAGPAVRAAGPARSKRNKAG